MNRKITVRGIIFNNEKLFVVRNKDKKGKPQKWLNLIGGQLEKGEGLISGLKREVVEEVGIEPVIGNLLFIQQFDETTKGKKREYIEFFFHIKNSKDFSKINLTATTHGLKELAEVKYINPTSNKEILPQFLQKVNIQKAIVNGKTQTFNYL